MPVMAIYTFDNVTADEYRDFRSKLPLDAAPKGALVHAFGRADDRFVTFEIWEDRRSLQHFLDGTLKPAVLRMGYPFTPPEVVEVEDFVVTRDVRDREIPIGEMLTFA